VALSPGLGHLPFGFNLDAGIIFDVVLGVGPRAAYFYQARARRGLDAFQRSEIRPQPYRLRRHMSTVAYSLSPAGAWKLLAEALPARPFTLTIPAGGQWPDTGVDMLLTALYDRLNAYVAFPPVMITPNNDETSTTLTRITTAVPLFPHAVPRRVGGRVMRPPWR
jgi:glycosyl transferase, family 25